MALSQSRVGQAVRSFRDGASLTIVSRLIWLVAQFLCRGLRLTVSGEENLNLAAEGHGMILACWHHGYLVPAFYLRNRGYHALVSLSRDGEYQDRIFRHLGWGTIRGSSGRGPVRALREAIRYLRNGGTFAITPDGPVGPPEKCQMGCVYLALASNAPIVPMGIHFQPHVRLTTWDRHMLPLPFARAHLHFGSPLRFGGDHHAADLEACCAQVEQALKDAMKQAQSSVGNSRGPATALPKETEGPSKTRGLSRPPVLPWLLYNCVLALGFPILVAFLLWACATRARVRRGLPQKLGFVPEITVESNAVQRLVWVHAVSVGELSAVSPLVEALKQGGGVRVALSVTTATGHGVATKRLAELVDHLFYFPLDFPFSVRRALDAVRPSALVLAEGEIWPNLLHECNKRGIVTMLINGRVSARTLARSAFARPLYRWALSNLDLICMQSPRDCRRIQALGADPALVKDTGNTKFDDLRAPVPEAVQRQLMLEFRVAPEHKVLLAGSTHHGEEEHLLDAYWQARVQVPELRLILVPRHTERAEEVERLIVEKGFRCLRRTQMPKAASLQGALEATAAPDDDPDRVVLVDTTGELRSLYSLCTLAFVGGSLVPRGGQNLLEPLAEGKPILFGPDMGDFIGPRELAVEAEVGFEVHNAAEIADLVVRFCRNPARLEQVGEKARQIISENKGASSRCTAYLMRLLGEAEQTAH